MNIRARSAITQKELSTYCKGRGCNKIEISYKILDAKYTNGYSGGRPAFCLRILRVSQIGMDWPKSDWYRGRKWCYLLQFVAKLRQVTATRPSLVIIIAVQAMV